MRRIILLTAFLLSFAGAFGQTQNGVNWDKYFISGSLSVGQGSNKWAHNAAHLQIGPDSTNKGFVPARVVDTSNVVSPRPLGLTVYQHKDSNYYSWAGNRWKVVGGKPIDTAAMLAPYLRKVDTTGKWASASGDGDYIQNQTGLTQPAGFKINGIGTANGFTATGSGIGLALTASDFAYSLGVGFYNTSTNKIRWGVGGSNVNIATENWVQQNAVITGHTIYVDKDAPNSTDARSGISAYSQSAPFKTFSAAMSAAVLGDVVYVRGGAYTESSDITFNCSGVVFDNATITSTAKLTMPSNFNARAINIINGANVTFTEVGNSFGGAAKITGDMTGNLTAALTCNSSGAGIQNDVRGLKSFTGRAVTAVTVQNIDAWTCTAVNSLNNGTSLIENVGTVTVANNTDFISYVNNPMIIIRNTKITCQGSGNVFAVTFHFGAITFDNVNATAVKGGDFPGGATVTVKNNCVFNCSSYLFQLGGGSLKVYNSEIRVGTAYILQDAGGNLITNSIHTNATQIIRTGGTTPTTQSNTNNILGISFL